MSEQWRIVAVAALFVAMATVTPVDAGDYPLAGITAFTSEGELAGKADEIKSKVDGLIGELAKFGATPADFAKTDACFFGFVKASPDGSVVSYQLDVDASEQAMEATSWPVPVAFKEVARTACVYDPAANAETCTNPDGSSFALVYFDEATWSLVFCEIPRISQRRAPIRQRSSTTASSTARPSRRSWKATSPLARPKPAATSARWSSAISSAG